MQFINLPPHTIKLNDGREFPPDGRVPRVATTYTTFDTDGICMARFGKVDELPDPADGTIFIVSGMVASAVAGTRQDIVAPATGHPDAVRVAGQIVSVPGFVRG